MLENLEKALQATEATLAVRTSELEVATENLKEKDLALTETQLLLEEKTKILLNNTSALRDAQLLLKQKESEQSSIEKKLVLESQQLEYRNNLLVEKTVALAASALELQELSASLAKVHNESFKHAAELEQRNTELIALNSELTNLLRQRDDFVASITHDLKNPLVGCNRILDAMIEGRVPQEDQQFLLSQIKSSNNHMLHMIWNLLDTYKHHSGALQPSLSATNLVALLHAILSEFSFPMLLKKQTANLEIQASFPDVHVDRVLLRRAIFNLVDNAIKFTPEGGSITVCCSFDASHIKLTVRDSGEGISYQMREKLFQQFWKGKRGQDNEIGTGLGLYLTKNIVELHGGILECSNADGSGAEFTIILNRRTEPC